MRGGGRNSFGSGRRRNEMMLRNLVESCTRKYSCSTVDDIVRHLRHNYANYRRMELKTLTRLVNVVLLQPPPSSSSQSPHRHKKSVAVRDGEGEEEEEEDGKLENSQRRKNKRQRFDGDRGEERLLQIEKDYSTRRNRDHLTVLTSSSGSVSESESLSSPSSTSEDVVFEERVEPEFDLTRSMLRERYSSTNLRKERNIELETTTDDKDTNKIDMANEHKAKVGGEGARSGKVEKVLGTKKEDKEGPKFRDLGGMQGVLKELEMEVFVPLFHPHVLQRLGVNPVGGILLHGPPGCGKTKLAHAIANEMGIPFYKISATEVVSGVSGASEENIRDLFNKAYRTAPSIVFIDEIDAIASKRDNLQREMERRIVTQLMTCMDDYHKLVQPAEGKLEKESSDQKPRNILVIGATNRPDAIDSALRRPGRFDREIRLGVPDENARLEILSVLTKKCTLEGTVDLSQIARSTPGYVGADLEALVDKAGNLAMRRILAQRKFESSSINEEHRDEWWKKPWSDEEIDKLAITVPDFEEATKLVQPSSRREGFSTIPDVKWEDVGGLDSIRNELNHHIVRRIKDREIYEKFGLDLETGILLYGPPGCGKTLIAKAVANEAGANFIHIKGPELLNKYVGESELAVRTLFTRARTCSPCVLFFDEVDALTNCGNEGGWVVDRLLKQLLIELDGADKRQSVFVIGATNRPEVMDPAVLRPGRFGKLLYIPLPSPDDRGLILKALSKGKPIDPDVDLSAIGKSQACENLSGADLKMLINEAAMAALVEMGSSDNASCTIKATHFEQAFSKITPSVSDKQIQYYRNWSQNLKVT